MSFIPGQTSETSESTAPQQELSETLEQGDATFVTSEPKKQISGGTLGVGGVLALCAGAVWFMFLRNGPQTANASDTTADSITAFVGEGRQHVTLMRQMLQNTEKVVQQFQKSTASHQVPLNKLTTNPFQMEAPKQLLNETSIAAKRRKDEERAAVVENVKSLRLQLILYGQNQRVAMINNKAYTEGQEVDSMKVEKILADRIILRSGVYRVEKVLVK